MDRDPNAVVKALRAFNVVVMGDAAHPMSPFKGQGANQALMDGPLLASWLGRSSLQAAMRGYHREMCQRSGPKVRQSRAAAQFLHSPQVLAEPSDFSGVQSEHVPKLLSELRSRGISAGDAGKLDNRIQETIRELGCAQLPVFNETSEADRSAAESEALELATEGDTAGLRKLSLQHVDQIRSAKDRDGRTCLHLAAVGGHYQTCRWLLTEALMSRGEDDKTVQSLTTNPDIVELFQAYHQQS